MSDDVRQSFARQTARLNDLLDAARPTLKNADVRLRNQSNENGFDSSGFPYFVWQWHFEKRHSRNGEIYSAAIVINYTEPPENQPPRVELTARTEIFQTGKLSRYKKSSRTYLPVKDFHQTDLAVLVVAHLNSVSFDE